MIAPLVFGLGAIFFYLEARIGVLIGLENRDVLMGRVGSNPTVSALDRCMEVWQSGNAAGC